MRYIIGTDTGGTFTDATVITEKGELFINKAPTTPHDFSIGTMDAVREVAKTMNLSLGELLKNCEMFKHGSTISTNALITRTGSRVGLITTRGFEDVTLVMRAIGRVAGLGEEEIKRQATCVKPEPIVSRDRIVGVTERVDFRGRVVIPINIEEAREGIRYLIEDQKVEALAINFLWGFINPTHEKTVLELIKEMYPREEFYVTAAHELVPVIREYSRSNTVIINSFLGKTINHYITNLTSQLSEAGYRKELLLMQSNGGIVHRGEISPIGTVGSGPCGGIIATKCIADLLGHKNVISTDMGGTSFDVGLLINGLWRYEREPVVGRFHISWPIIDIESIGAGGGTIARVDPVTNRLLVGPESGGADPGPICYDIGGDKVTVTDADLILGILDPDYFLGGRMKLNKEKALEYMEKQIAKPLGMDVVEAAAGIFEITTGHMSDLIRKQVVASGYIPEEFNIYAFGGAGPVHGAAYSSDLNIKTMYVFPTSAVFSAFGIATADIMHTHTQSYRYRMPVDPGRLNQTLKVIEDSLYERLERENVSREKVEFRRIFHMRYRRQLNELPVVVPTKVYNEADIQEIMKEFNIRFDEVYGSGAGYQEAGIEIISFSVDAIGKMPKPPIKSEKAGGEDPSGALKGQREVYFTNPTNKFLQARIYEYDLLKPENQIEGPAVVESPITTVLIPPKVMAEMDEYRNLKLSLSL